LFNEYFIASNLMVSISKSFGVTDDTKLYSRQYHQS